MQGKFPDGSVIITGRLTKDAEMRHVGDKGSALLSFGVFVGKRKDTTGIFVECAAWNALAEQLNGLKKGDSFAGVGTVKSREYEEKTYKTLELDWGNSPALNGKATRANAPVSAGTPESPDIPDVSKDGFDEKAGDDDLPF